MNFENFDNNKEVIEESVVDSSSSSDTSVSKENCNIGFFGRIKKFISNVILSIKSFFGKIYDFIYSIIRRILVFLRIIKN